MSSGALSPQTPDAPGVQPVSKASAAYQQLRTQIRTGALAPGQRVTLKHLSEMLGMSLTPVREALGRLQSEGFVVHDTHVGARIAEFNQERLEQTYRLRMLLEPEAVKRAAHRVVTQNLTAELETLQNLLTSCDAAGTSLEVAQRNEAFHRAMYRLAGDGLLLEFIEKLWAGVPYQSFSLYGDSARVEQSSREHHAILAALSKGDAEEAGDQLLQHIMNGQAAALKKL